MVTQADLGPSRRGGRICRSSLVTGLHAALPSIAELLRTAVRHEAYAGYSTYGSLTEAVELEKPPRSPKLIRMNHRGWHRTYPTPNRTSIGRGQTAVLQNDYATDTLAGPIGRAGAIKMEGSCLGATIRRTNQRARSAMTNLEYRGDSCGITGPFSLWAFWPGGENRRESFKAGTNHSPA
jgi:hypothetical protein